MAPADSARSRRGARVCLVAVGIAAGVVGLYFLLYAASVHAFVPDSDSATVVLEGFAMTHGHLLLSNWAISLDSFWTVDAVFNALAVAVYGIHPLLMHAVPVAIAVAVVVFGVLISTSRLDRSARLAAGGTVVVLLALPSQAWANFFLRGPWHIGTALFCLVAFYAMQKVRYGIGFVVAVVFLAAGMLGDLQMAALGVAPMLGAGIVCSLRTRSVRRGLPLVLAAISSVVLAEVVRRIARAIGSFTIAAANPRATFPEMLRNLHHGIHEGIVMMGFSSAYYGLGAVPRGLSYVHVLAIALVALAVVGATVALLIGAIRGRPTAVLDSEEEWFVLDDLLLLGALASFVAFVVLATTADPTYGRYLSAGIIFGAVLAGRLVGRAVRRTPAALCRVALAVGLAAASCFAAGLALDLDQPSPTTAAGGLVSFLKAHHLDNGVGSYWAASLVTVQSGGAVDVRPVIDHGGKLVRYDRNSAGYWYDRPFDFVVYDLAIPWGAVSAASATASFGHPRASYVVGGRYEVLVFQKPFSVSPRPPAG